MGRYIGVDLGSTTITGVVLDTGKREILAQELVSNDVETTPAASRASGRSEWDMNAMAACAIGLVGRLGQAAGPGSITGIGVTGQMHGMVLLCRDGEALTPFIGWQDGRCLESMPNGRTYIEEMRLRGGADASAPGCRPATGYMGATLFWLAQHGLVPSDAMACFAPDFLVSRLCDIAPSTDPTNAASAGVYDIRRGQWNENLMRAWGLQAQWLPEVRPSCTRAGGLSREIAQETGLPEGIPVAIACGDNQASFAGSVADSGGSVLINVGTGGQASAYTDEMLESESLDIRPFLQGGYMLVGAELCGGRSYQVLRDFVQQVGAEVFGVEHASGIYERLNALAAAVAPGADGLRCDPVFAGSRAEPGLRAVWRGMGEGNFTPGHMARALLEGLAGRFHALYEAMLDAGMQARPTVVGAGNGVRYNAVFREILSEQFTSPVMVTRHTEEAAAGAALAASVAVGEFVGIHDASKHFIQYKPL